MEQLTLFDSVRCIVHEADYWVVWLRLHGAALYLPRELAGRALFGRQLEHSMAVGSDVLLTTLDDMIVEVTTAFGAG